MKCGNVRSLTLATATILAGFGCHEVMAQARPVGRAAQVAAAAETGKEVIVIRKITGHGTEGKVKTPEYSVSPVENSRPKDWLRVTVTYETESEWIDELEFRYFLVVKHPKTGAFTMFPGNVTYVDVAMARNHVSTVFLRPNIVARYGELERVAVEIYVKGELAAAAGLPETPPNWWRSALNVKTMEGVLMNRSQTPFALIGYDNYETIKPR